MIHAKFFRDTRGAVQLEMSGHALAAPTEEDMVCAAATTLAYTLAQAVQFAYEQGWLATAPTIKICDGYAHIVARPKPMYEAETLLMFWTVQAGAYTVERNYPSTLCLMPMEIGR